MALLELQHVSCFLGHRAALADVTLSVPRGTLTALLGEKGAGKSVLLGCVSGHQRPDRGRIRLAGVRLDGLPPQRCCRLGVGRLWAGAPRLLTGGTALDEALLGALARTGRVDAARARGLEELRRVGLEAEAGRPAAELGPAARRRLELARALAADPALLLLDEPLAGLDAAGAAEVLEVIGALRRDGLTLLWACRAPGPALSLCDRAVILAAGEKAAEGAPGELRHDPAVRSTAGGSRA